MKKTAFPIIWKEIMDFHSVNYRSRLRIAANLIGFHLFPAGWTWNEYQPIVDTDSCGYEESAINALQNHTHGIIADVPPSKPRKKAELYRKHQVESFLRKAIERRIVPIYQGSLAEPRALKEYKKVKQRLDDQDIRHFDVERSTIGARMYSKRICEVDAAMLIEHLLTNIENRGGVSKCDWIVIELWFRRSIENHGLPDNHSACVQELQAWYAARDLKDDSEPPTDRCKKLLKSLCNEYGYIRKTGFIPL